ncbi:MAG: valine--tRNA ligase [Candidatus Aenigmarchaeota archaeon]|nr:valine--tRNA ligase [Candidatus Aenigmarchaeota archaeon]
MTEPRLKGKRWDTEFEGKLRRRWKARWPYGFEQKSKKPVYSIDTPPPYVNTPVHIGQATTYVMMDMFARFRRMTGHNVLFPLGLDRNGLPIEMAAEKKYNVKLTSLTRAKAMQLCRSILKEASMASVDSFFRLGVSFNSWKKGTGIGGLYETDSPDYRALTQETFIDMWNKGIIYEDERVNNFCPGCQTTLADAEIDYENRRGFYYHIRFKVKETGEDIIIATTRPELVCTIGMVIYNPDDDRYKHLEGKTAIAPIFGKHVKIRAHPSAEIERGTGIMMVCSFGDLADIRFFREMDIEPVIAINKDGTMNENAGFLQGMTIEEARARYLEELEKLGLVIDKEPTHEHRTPVCERSKDAIEFISMKEYYVKQVEFKRDMKRLARKMDFFAPKSRQILLDWIDSVSIDWPISRRRYYATEVPIWYCKGCGQVIVPPKGKYYRPWLEPPPPGSAGLSRGKCSKCGSSGFRGEERVFDTWFDSSISPLYILKYSRPPLGFFSRNQPCSLRPQGKEIVRTWLYYTVLKDWLLTGKCIFKDVWINYHIVDERGKKMSKRTGNAIDPKEVLDRFGAEPFRLWAAIEGNLEKTDFRCSFDRIEGAGKTLTKLWNIARFISMFPPPKRKPGMLCPLDEWALAEIGKIAAYARDRYNKYDFHNPATKMKNFLWEAFASHYLELVKNRAYNQDGRFTREEQDSARFTLNSVLDQLLLLLAPIVPFITATIFMDLRGADIHSQPFPKPDAKTLKKRPGFGTKDIMELNGMVWKAKKDKGLSLKSGMKELCLPRKLKPLETDIVATHKAEKLSYGKAVRIRL